MFDNRYKDYLNAIEDGLYCVNPEGLVVFWNRAMEALTGIDAERAKNTPVLRLITYLDEKGHALESSDYPCLHTLRSLTTNSKKLFIKIASDRVFTHVTASPVIKDRVIDSVVTVIKRQTQLPCSKDGLVHICAWCKKIQCAPEEWTELESYLTNIGLGVFTHSMCPACSSKIFEKKIYLESYQKICKAISSSVSLKEVFDLIVKNVVKVMNTKASMLRLLDHKTNRLEVAAYYGLSERYVNKGPVDCDKSIVDTLEGKTVSIYNIAEDPYAKYKKEAIEEGISTILSVPVKDSKGIIGVLRMYSSEPIHYTEEDLKFITALAEQAAIAINNAKTFETTVSRAKDYLRVFREVTKAVSSTLDLKEVLELIVRKLPETMGLKGATVRLLDEDGRRLRLVADYGLSSEYLNKGPIDMEDNVKIALQQGAVAIYDVSNDPRVIYKQEAVKEGIKSMLTLPITVKGKVIGILRLFTSEHRHFTDEDIDFTTSLAEVCGAAIENAKHHELIKSKRGD